jgi:hypothetical protein
VTPTGPTVVAIAATRASTDETGASVGNITFTRTGDTSTSLLINYSVGGSATNGIDYLGLNGTVTLPSGAASAVLEVKPYVDTTPESTETVTVTLLAGTGYTLGTTTTATVAIADSPGTLYVSTLRPATGASGSVASGLASIILSADGSLATVNVSFSNLSSGQPDRISSWATAPRRETTCSTCRSARSRATSGTSTTRHSDGGTNCRRHQIGPHLRRHRHRQLSRR